MNEGRALSLGVIVMTVLWGTVVALLGGAAVAISVGDTNVALLCGFTACACSAAAAVAHIRCYASRVCQLVRLTQDLVGNASQGADLRRLNPR